MMNFTKISFLLLFAVVVTVNGNEFENYTCPDLCDPNSCSVPDNECLAGLVKVRKYFNESSWVYYRRFLFLPISSYSFSFNRTRNRIIVIVV